MTDTSNISKTDCFPCIDKAIGQYVKNWLSLLSTAKGGCCDGFTIDFDPGTELCKEDQIELAKVIDELIAIGDWCAHDSSPMDDDWWPTEPNQRERRGSYDSFRTPCP